MKFIRFALGVSLALLSLGVVGKAEAFEGKVSMLVAEGKQQFPLSYLMKEDKMRMELPAAKSEGMAGVIIDFKAKHMLMLMEMEGRKMYMKHSLGAEVAKVTGEEVLEPKPTGKTEVIAGYSADEYELKNKDDSVTHLWLGKGLGNFISPAAMQGGPFGGGSQKASPTWEAVVKKSGLFPLRVITVSAKGKELNRMEVTQIEKVSVPDSVFSTTGYTEFQMPGFGGGMPGMNEDQ